MRRGVLLFAVALVFLAALPARADDLGAAVNAVRSPALAVSGPVDGFAQAAADRIAGGQSLVHSNLSGILGTCSAAGEVIGYGPNIAAVMQGFANSPGHWSVITQKKWNAMGTGVTVDGNGRMWVAVVFCTLLTVSAPPTPTTAPPPPPPVTVTTAAPAPATTAPPPPAPPPTTTAPPPPPPEPVIQRYGPVVSIDGTVSLLLGASPFLPAEDWQTFKTPTIS
ncbi:hypothetical protein BH18ACT5_BH18ACT5_04800 [soil metagenome]